MSRDTGLYDDLFDALGKVDLPGKLKVLPDEKAVEYKDQTGGCAWLLMGPACAGFLIFAAFTCWPSVLSWICIAGAIIMVVTTIVSNIIGHSVIVRQGQIVVAIRLFGHVWCRTYAVPPGQLEIYVRIAPRGVIVVYGIRIQGRVFGKLPVTGSKREVVFIKSVFDRALGLENRQRRFEVTKKEKSLSPRRTMLVGIVVIAIGAYLLASAIGLVGKGRNSLDWPTTDGKVVHSEVDELSHGYKAEIRYIYSVDENPYTGDTVYVGSHWGNYEEACRIVARYPEGKKVRVFFNPDDPRQAVLESGPQGTNFAMFFPIPFLALGLLCLGIGFYGYTKKRGEELRELRGRN